MSYEKFKEFCKEAWKEKYIHLAFNTMDDEELYCI